MSSKKFPKSHQLIHYYRDVVEFDTAHDARHCLSILTSVFPDIRVSFPDFDSCVIENVTNHLFKKLKFTWRNKI